MEQQLEPKVIRTVLEALHSYRMVLIMRGILKVDKDQDIDFAIKIFSSVEDDEVKH